jgi:hypothetical protein
MTQVFQLINFQKSGPNLDIIWKSGRAFNGTLDMPINPAECRKREDNGYDRDSG